MSVYKAGSHTKFVLNYHLVWTTKYRKQVLKGDIGLRTRDLLTQICSELDVEIITGHISKDHVHLFVSAPPSLSVSKLVQRLKGKSSYKLMKEFPSLQKTYWGQHFWATGYFACSSGNITDETIKEYIKNQDKEQSDNFTIHDKTDM